MWYFPGLWNLLHASKIITNKEEAYNYPLYPLGRVCLQLINFFSFAFTFTFYFYFLDTTQTRHNLNKIIKVVLPQFVTQDILLCNLF